MSDEQFIESLKASLQECRDIQSSNALPSIKAIARKKVIEALTVDHADNWQCVATPYDIINEMCDLVKEAEHYIVFFSLEFLEVMIHERGISPDKILFIADNITESQVASHISMYGVKSIIFGKNDINQRQFNSAFLYMCINKIGDFMKFNKLAVIANFPYQVPDEGNSTGAKPIYNLFIESVIDNIKPDYFASINPSRWMTSGKGLDKHRERMMNDTRIKKIVHFSGDHEIFPTVCIRGGVSYWLWQKDYNGECEFVNGNSTTYRFLNTHDIILQDNNAFGILEKVLSQSTYFLNSVVSSRKPFGLATNFSNFITIVNIVGNGTNSNKPILNTVPCYCNGKAVKIVNKTDFTDKENIIGKWKVGIAYSGDGASSNPDKNGMYSVIGTPFIIAPNSICTETYLIAHSFDNKESAEHFISYMKTKMFRFLLSLRVSTQHVTSDKYSWVPDQIDYSTSWTDAELYKKYNLSRQEIAYIESKIKAI